MQPSDRNARRILAVVYDLADGRTDVPVSEAAIIDRARELAVFDMTDEQFESWRLATVTRVRAQRAEAGDVSK